MLDGCGVLIWLLLLMAVIYVGVVLVSAFLAVVIVFMAAWTLYHLIAFVVDEVRRRRVGG